jgi:hypothetical protein
MFTLDQIVPWGRSFDEYVAMFALTEADLARRILGCSDGPASFNAVATVNGITVVSCDPIYQWGVDEIQARIDATCEQVIEQTRRNLDEFVWDSIPSVEALGRVRMSAMRAFLRDYPTGAEEGRYVVGELPVLPFDDGAFDLAVCSHFLFLYSQQLDAAFHQTSLQELCRVAREVRVFPLLALGGAVSPHVDRCVSLLRDAGFVVSIERVPYEFQRGGNEMLRVQRGDSRTTALGANPVA